MEKLVKKEVTGIVHFQVSKELKKRFNEVCRARGMDITKTQIACLEYAMERFMELSITHPDVKAILRGADNGKL